ncbi:hypothetical protein TPA0910_41780 [Streptomyces hygroscopicus subsp. sporocinereus]|uniref:Uncharacterized protein n=1 Tax=Streptomyces hygroscopicus TaxID=1912 RepID=A0ABQ3U2B7_STRHY|nr:hypothetical protein [Streptomyces hygroscopicus]GHJ29745.1 hypothetical protein TPA0910_41780 [Streptomyces hygroscopicus]
MRFTTGLKPGAPRIDLVAGELATLVGVPSGGDAFKGVTLFGGEAAAFDFPGLGQDLRAVERGNALRLFPRLA